MPGVGTTDQPIGADAEWLNWPGFLMYRAFGQAMVVSRACPDCDQVVQPRAQGNDGALSIERRMCWTW